MHRLLTFSLVPFTAENGQQLGNPGRALSANVHATQSGSATHLEQQLAASGAVVPEGNVLVLDAPSASVSASGLHWRALPLATNTWYLYDVVNENAW